MKLSKVQKLAQLMDGRMKGKHYIVNRKEEGQPRFIKCVCCGKKFDLKDSADYIGAINQWEAFGKKCYACGKGFCHCKELSRKRNMSTKGGKDEDVKTSF